VARLRNAASTFASGFVARRFRFDESARKIRRRHEVAAQRLGQSANQLGDLLAQQAGHQPFAARVGSAFNIASGR
jgi:hypothetical protein